jgi:hypothetical protein
MPRRKRLHKCEGWSGVCNARRCPSGAIPGMRFCGVHLKGSSAQKAVWTRLNAERGPWPERQDPRRKLLFCGDCNVEVEHCQNGPFWRCSRCNEIWPTSPDLIQHVTLETNHE